MILSNKLQNLFLKCRRYMVSRLVMLKIVQYKEIQLVNNLDIFGHNFSFL